MIDSRSARPARWIAAGVGVVAVVLGLYVLVRPVSVTEGVIGISRDPAVPATETSVSFDCGSAIQPKHRSQAEARAVLGFDPLVLSAQHVVNSQCDPTPRRVRGGLEVLGGLLALAAATLFRRLRWFVAAVTPALLLIAAGLPGLFATTG